MRVLRAMGLHRPAFRLAGPLAAALMLLTLAAQPAVAGPFTDLIIFGDSLSDIGNVSTATATLMPGPSYFAGRFSNGPVYAEILASGLGLGPLSASLNGGDDYAYGAALTSGTPFPSSIVVKDLDDQVDQYLGSRTPDPAALFVIFGGANDVRNQLSAAMPNVAAAASNLATDITDLYDRGARKFLVANVPALGFTPGFNNDPTQARVVKQPGCAIQYESFYCARRLAVNKARFDDLPLGRGEPLRAGDGKPFRVRIDQCHGPRRAGSRTGRPEL